ncbi:hypothetical protein FA15DRAFT_128763 [Coprinopsis marcescibilis]|uniref:F-box domain-containing protein n=1 Tax=Coprinopsis marcescibilis TaxID=230819 RepID=A0A5C3KJC3_COPMA|nr:hypothetical protein FA15DRAFT_128763 [Coprinopsis marcescibilis]
MTQGPTILPEIAQHIAGLLEDDRPSLRAVSSISSVFRWPCQEILFSKLVLAPPKAQQSYLPGKNLIYQFDEAPVLASFIKELVIEERCQEHGGGASWFIKDQYLPDALERLATLGRIKTFALKRSSDSVEWLRLQGSLRDAFEEICRSPRLTSLTLWWTPMSLISNLRTPALSYLELKELEPIVGQITRVENANTRVSSLALEYGERKNQQQVVEALLDPSFIGLTFRHIHTLKICGSSSKRQLGVPELIGLMLTRYGETLKTLVMNGSSFPFDTGRRGIAPFSFAALSNVTEVQLTLHHVEITDMRDHESLLPHLEHIFKSFLHPSQLEIIRLRLTYVTYGGAPCNFDYLTPLDLLLTDGNPQLSKLRQVVFKVDIRHHDSTFDSSGAIERSLPNLNRLGKLIVEVDDRK